MTNMRAKLQVGSVFAHRNPEGVTTTESVTFFGVSKSTPYPEDGADDDNTFA